MSNAPVRSAMHYLLASLWALSITLLLACGDKTLPASVGGYNHMNDWSIAWFTVDGSGGPNLTPESGEAGSKCCASIPEKWYPGMKVKVRWAYDTRPDGPAPPPPPDQEAIVEIPEYTKDGGSIQAHFYPNHQVKVVISSYGLEHPRNPLSEPDKWPWETRKDLIEYEKKQGKLAK